MNEMRLAGNILLRGRIVVCSGLHIGGSQDVMGIGSLDNPVVRNPANGEPFIPGSSLRGRMRSLAEWHFGEVPDGGEVIAPIIGSKTARVFGIPAKDPKKVQSEEHASEYQRGPTRLIVRDAPLSEESRNSFAAGRPISEVKNENSINRLTAMANPRPMERVLPEVTFDCELVYRVFDLGDQGATDRQLFDEVVLTALALVEADALGGGGGRGNGKVRFELTRDGEQVVLPELAYQHSA